MLIVSIITAIPNAIPPMAIRIIGLDMLRFALLPANIFRAMKCI